VTLLGRTDIAAAMEHSNPDLRLTVVPLLDKKQVGRGAIDLRLGTEFLVLRQARLGGIDPGSSDERSLKAMYERVAVPFGEDFWLHPRHFALASTLEFIGMPTNLGAYVVSRSSWGRLGLLVATAVFVHPGFRGCLTLELVNEGDSPIKLSPGLRVAQLVLHSLETPVALGTDEVDKYLAPVRPEPSLLARETAEFERLAELGRKLRSRLG
jgi:dCTP deaminase